MIPLTKPHVQLANMLYNCGALHIPQVGREATRPEDIQFDMNSTRLPRNARSAYTERITDLAAELLSHPGVRPAYFDCYVSGPLTGRLLGNAMVAHLQEGNWHPKELKLSVTSDRRILPDVSGDFTAGQECLIVDDLLKRAVSKHQITDYLSAAGLKVTALVVLIDFQLGGTQQMRDLGVDVTSVFAFRDLLEYYWHGAFINDEQYEVLESLLPARSAVR